jgi:hypothetical protein
MHSINLFVVPHAFSRDFFSGPFFRGLLFRALFPGTFFPGLFSGAFFSGAFFPRLFSGDLFPRTVLTKPAVRKVVYSAAGMACDAWLKATSVQICKKISKCFDEF